MILFRNYLSPISLNKPIVATIGNFDGLHRGHQALLNRIKELRPKNGSSLVVSFYPHPSIVIGGVEREEYITSYRQRTTLLSQFGIDAFCLIHFTKNFSSFSAADFVNEVIIKNLDISNLVVGTDWTFGKGRSGNLELLKRLLNAAGRECTEIPFELLNGTKISSREIRNLVRQGDVAGVAEPLGRYFEIEGRVVRGEGRGKKIGIPTANLASVKQVMPKHGVYATYAHIGGKKYPSVTNIGLRPTFKGQSRSIETYVPSFDGEDFYGTRLALSFVKRIRDERRFENVSDLVSQIKLDAETAQEFLVPLMKHN